MRSKLLLIIYKNEKQFMRIEQSQFKSDTIKWTLNIIQFQTALRINRYNILE